MYRLAINGYGRIGRSVLRALSESDVLKGQMQIIAINEPADCETICHLTRFDSTHGRFPGQVSVAHDCLSIDGQSIALSHHQNIADIRWPDVDCVLECSGTFTDRETAEHHLQNGAKKVLFSQPALESDVDRTVVFGVNEALLHSDDYIISNASCTTNASVPVLKLINDHFGISSASITTIHSAMNDQPVIDAYHATDLRKTRSASQSMIPVDTGLAKGIERFLPELTGLLSAQAIRIPTVNVSALDISVVVKEDVSVAAVNTLLQHYAQSLPAIIGFNDQPLASIDFNHDARSCIVDGTQTRVSGGRLLKLFIWFDNEWAYANRMLDVAAHLQNLQHLDLVINNNPMEKAS
ncbi:MAG: erythrose-4-phosphate dehydrogenase [Pseudomonadales bacterium]|nr:erythrose-4-phosphate dehydrogenase [Pseudomonadales bacterium]